MLFTMCMAQEASRPPVSQAARPNARPVKRIVITPYTLYGWSAAKAAACRATASSGSRNQDPSDCMTSPRKQYSSAAHCSGPSMVTRMNPPSVNATGPDGPSGSDVTTDGRA